MVAESTAAAHAFIECPFPRVCDLIACGLVAEQVMSLIT